MVIATVEDLCTERRALLDTLDALDDESFEHGTTLCDEWAPRDVLAHLMGIDISFHRYLLAFGNTAKANGQIVEAARRQPRIRIMTRARRWADEPAPHVRLAAPFLMGDLAIHHQDVLRGAGQSRDVPVVCREAILREAYVLGPKRWIKHKVSPLDGGPSFGFGSPVRGTSEALGMWLAGRQGIESELDFEDFLQAPAPDDGETQDASEPTEPTEPAEAGSVAPG